MLIRKKVAHHESPFLFIINPILLERFYNGIWALVKSFLFCFVIPP